MMDDLNAKVGSDNTNHDRAMEKEGCGCMNNEGESLLVFCMTYDLVIGGTRSSHHEIHKLTLCSPNGDKNQIDHLIMNGIWRTSFQDVRPRKGNDIGSDRYLVTVTLKVKLGRNGLGKARQHHYQIRIVYKQTSEARLGRREKRRKEWIIADTWQAIESRRALKQKVMNTRSERLSDAGSSTESQTRQ